MALKLKIKNFKSIEEVSTELGDLTILLGHPASGKSNLLEALEALGYAVKVLVEKPLGEYPEEAHIAPFNSYVRALRCVDVINRFARPRHYVAGVSIEDVNRGHRLSLNLDCTKDPNKIRMSLNIDNNIGSFEALLWERSPTTSRIGADELTIFFDALKSFAQILGAIKPVDNINQFESIPRYVMVPRLYGFDRMGVVWNIMYGYTGSKYPFSYVEERATNLGWILYNNDDLLEDVNEIIESSIRGLSIEPLSNGRLAFKDHGKDVGPVSVSDTVLRMLYAITTLISSKPIRYEQSDTIISPLIMLEEPEAHIYPLVYSKLVYTFRDALMHGSKILVTTHSGNLAERLWEEYNSSWNVRIYFVYRNTQKGTTLYEVTLPDVLEELPDLEALISQPEAKIKDLIENELLKIV
ncbi:MAG: AAA family ATPase [Desulfurococcales archaeon]|nr:AAA family ATPase [Desulfurococcales archaeon]